MDWIAKNIYWTSLALDGIFVSKTNGRYVHHLLSDVSSNPRGIALDPRYGVLFFADYSIDSFIARVGMDGGDSMKKIIKDHLYWPVGLTIDYTTHRLYWIDAHLNRIESSNYDGHSRYIVLEEVPHGATLAVFEDSMYWSERDLKQVEKANKRTGADRELLFTLAHQPFGIHVVHPLQQQPHDHRCAIDNGGCDQLCLIADGGIGVTCACSAYFELQPDKQ